METLWTEVWAWLASNATAERVSIFISLIAVFVAIRGMRHTRRNARAAESQAKAAEVQAKAAEEQVEAAKEQLTIAESQLRASIHSALRQEAEHIAEATALIDYRNFLEVTTPKLIVGLEPVTYPPYWEPNSRHSSTERAYPRPERDTLVFDHSENQFYGVGFIVRGTLMNVGDTAALVYLGGPMFVEGTSSLTQGAIFKPLCLGSGRGHLLRPGEIALFEWKAEHTLDNWMELYKKEHRGDFANLPKQIGYRLEHPSGSIVAHSAGSAGEADVRISMELNGNVVWPHASASRNHLMREQWVTYTSGCVSMAVNTEYLRMPKSLEDLRKITKGVNPFTGRVDD
ncbi:hypothetical protein [Nonomuraea insulae]|uniref:YkuD domain-containing protein n=1 Tax=Nonomuraea insulae TaxID=1616787 RepID=A0ABW1CSI6_9ACTN